MDERTQIWREKWRLDIARIEKMREAMAEYDHTVHMPAVRALQGRCAAIGHVPQSKYHFGPTGWSWQYCNQCGAKINLEPPDREDSTEDAFPDSA